MPRKVEVTIGADPEFAFSKDDRPVRADSLLRGGTTAKFGTDGAPNTAELRPDPATSAAGLVENIRKVIADEVRRNPRLLEYDWIAEPCFNGQPLGGHVHFGMRADTEFVKALDVLLAYPAAMLESSASAKRRKRSYGDLGGWRTQPWGFEYRSLSTWLTDENRALAVLSVAHALAVLWKADRPALAELYSLAGGDLSEQERVAFRSHNRGAMRARCLMVRDALKALRNAALMKEHLDGIRQFCGLVRVGAWKGVGKLGPTIMNWTVDGAPLKADAVQRAEASKVRRAAERKAARARRAQVASVDYSNFTSFWANPVVAGGVPVAGLSFNSSDDRLEEICRPMVSNARTLLRVRVHGLVAERPQQVVVQCPTTECRSRVEAAVRRIVMEPSAVGVSFEVREGSTFTVGLRRDLREDQELCRKVVAALALAASGVLGVL